VESCLGQTSKRSAQLLKPCDDIVTPDQQHAFERLGDGIPPVHSMLGRKVEQRPDETVRRGQIAGEERDWTSRVEQGDED
jgi:hypothetical protein